MVKHILSRPIAWLAGLQSDHEERKRQRQIERKQYEIEKLKYNLERSCYEIYAQHLKECLTTTNPEPFEREAKIEGGIQVRLRTFFNPWVNHRQTIIRATSPDLPELLEMTFSHRAVSQSKQWIPVA